MKCRRDYLFVVACFRMRWCLVSFLIRLLLMMVVRNLLWWMTTIVAGGMLVVECVYVLMLALWASIAVLLSGRSVSNAVYELLVVVMRRPLLTCPTMSGLRCVSNCLI